MPPSPTHHTSSRLPLRAAVLWLCVLALLAGSVDLHSLAGGHTDVAHLGAGAPFAGQVEGEAVAACPVEHSRRTHAEAASRAEVEHCQACVQRVQTRAGQSTGQSGLATQSAATLSAAIPRVTLHPALEHAPSRGPPAA